MSRTTRRFKTHTAHQRGRRKHHAPVAQERGPRHGKIKGRAVEEDTPARVTDHALVRWLERVEGIDIRDKIEAAMFADGRAELVDRIVSGRIRIADTDTVLVIKNCSIVSVVIEPRHG